MTRREIAQLACKLFALWFLCQLVIQFFHVGAGLLIEIPAAIHRGSEDTQLAFVLVPAATMCFYALLAMILWRFSKGIASAMVSDDPAPITSRNLDARSLLSLAIAAIGVFIAVETIPVIGRNIYIMWQIAQPNWNSPEFTYKVQSPNLWSHVLKLALAIWLIFGSRGIAKMIRRWRSARPTKPIDSKPSQDPGM